VAEWSAQEVAEESAQHHMVGLGQTKYIPFLLQSHYNYRFLQGEVNK
jgi:hypothetical protein